eukprot:s1252_g21.t1
MDLRRQAGERISEFSTRFRTVVTGLKSEGVVIQDSELGWFLREKLALGPLRCQLLDAALQGDESYARIESKILRLLKDLHQSDPLFRRAPQDGFKPRLTEPEAEVDEVYEITAADEPISEEPPALEEYLLNEAEVFAAELKDAEECGVDAQLLEELEADFQQAAETLAP